MSNLNFFTEVKTFFQTVNIPYQLVEDVVLNLHALNKQFAFIKQGTTYPQIKIHIEDSICIHEDIWRSRNSQVKSRLFSLLGLNKKIHARQCIAKQIDKKEAEEFLNLNHIQGYRKCATRIGLYKEYELIAVATFSSGRKMNRLKENERSYELISFASKNHITVVGGFDKLIKQFTKLKSPADIMTYVDLEWGNADAFLKLGFEQVGVSKPLTFYVDENFVRHKENDIKQSRIMLTNKGNIKLVKIIHK